MDLVSSIENLSLNQRALLAHRITEELTASTSEQIRSERQHLIAYVVSSSDPTPASDDLRTFLSDKLPDYMIPATFVPLKTLPLTPNGKVDRQALPEPDPPRREMPESVATPRNEVEEKLARIWAEALGVEVVGVHENFFALGGHSLLAVQLISQVRASFHVEIPMRSLIESPTVAKLADRIETIRWARGESQPSQTATRDEREEVEL